MQTKDECKHSSSLGMNEFFSFNLCMDEKMHLIHVFNKYNFHQNYG
jgi:hypothetical protein